MPPGVTPITELKHQKRVSRTLSKAVSLHLEGKLESASHLLGKAIDDGEKEPGLFSALGHIQYEMRDYSAAASTYAQLIEVDAKHRTAWFNLGVCQGHQKNWPSAVESFRKAADVDPTRADALLGLGIALIHNARAAEALPPIEKYLQQFPDHEQALFGKAVVLQYTGKHAEAVEFYRRVLSRNRGAKRRSRT